MICLQAREKLVVSNDWLQFSGQLILHDKEDVTAPEIECPEGYRLELLTGTNVFRYRAMLFDWKGRKVLTAMWSPYSSGFNPRLINFEVANYWLYQPNFYEVCRLSYEIHNYTFLCITRIDIACDFELTKRCRRIVDALYTGKMYVANKHEGNKWWNQSAIGEFAHDMNFGSHKSDFKWKLYDKSRELKVLSKKPEKPYIWQSWQAYGMNVTNVWRLEVSITKGSSLKVNGQPMTLEDAVRDSYLVNLFGELYKKRFVIRKRQHHSRKSNDRVIEFLNYPFDGWLVETPRSAGNETEQTASMQMNRLCDIIESPQAMSDTIFFDAIADSLKMLVSRYHLTKYFIRAKGETLPSYLARRRDLVGQGIVDMETKEKVSLMDIGASLNACWLRKLWLERQ